LLMDFTIRTYVLVVKRQPRPADIIGFGRSPVFNTTNPEQREVADSAFARSCLNPRDLAFVATRDSPG
jgi:hypothetical protein